ncbi:unnamed protein product [Paramecium octaurelia]|uniref:Uncharacterized protein n=1 Tax=Paramecium octaurelia TaxID=43137 RepID=A0A8S1WH89_PAROT|nr:unnamed protein product [Paramecium octaurelia]
MDIMKMQQRTLVWNAIKHAQFVTFLISLPNNAKFATSVVLNVQLKLNVQLVKLLLDILIVILHNVFVRMASTNEIKNHVYNVKIQSNKCLTCDTSNFQYFQMNSCPLDAYYDVGIEMCQKCSQICKTCSICSTKCQSCFPNHLRAVNQNDQCSNSCQTWKNQKDYCTSCDVNQSRLNQSIIHKCPGLTDFYQDSNEICQKCHIKCSGCVNERNNCLSCKYLQGSNRITISNQCNCKDGYYDDDFQIICNKCDSR